MVAIKSLMIAVIVAIAPVAQAWNCTSGLEYCYNNLVKFSEKNPWTLVLYAKALGGMRKRSVEDRVLTCFPSPDYDAEKLTQATHNLPLFKLRQTKFHCNEDGSVTLDETCMALCMDAGQGRSDFCF